MSNSSDNFYPATLTSGTNGLPKVVLASPDGAQAEVYLHGAHVTSWIPADGNERLYLSRTTEFSPQAAIRGGVPIIFPQFSSLGPLPKHGFARRMDWKFMKAENRASEASAVFQLKDSPATRSIWPYNFSADFEVKVKAQQLTLSLAVTNLDTKVFSFSAALHTYLGVADIQGALLTGLGGKRFIDSTQGNLERIQEEMDLTFKGEVDRIYTGVHEKMTLLEKERRMEIENMGFPDVVVWNPWIEKGAALADLEPEGYRHMLCIEAAVANNPVTLQPSASWSGTQQLLAG